LLKSFKWENDFGVEDKGGLQFSQFGNCVHFDEDLFSSAFFFFASGYSICLWSWVRIGKILFFIYLQGWQMVCFQTKHPNLGKFWRVLLWKILVYFMTIWSILRPLEIFMAFGYILLEFGIFFPFWNFGPRKIWQPYIPR
jgi:hypothetical protein